MTSINLREWQCRSPENARDLLGGKSFDGDSESRELARLLNNTGMLKIVELRSGLQIESTSFVGQITLGRLDIRIRPKIDHNVLKTLFQYAFNLRDLKFLSETTVDHEVDAFQDLMIHQLGLEVSELLSRGLHRQYRESREYLGTPKGRIDHQRVALNGGITSASIPCIHYPRSENSLANRVLLSGLYLSTTLTGDLLLRSHLRRLAAVLEDTVTRIPLSRNTFELVWHHINRQTRAYQPALRLIELLYQSSGITLEDELEHIKLPGFLFDMNKFFEALITRFLRENLPEFEVRDQVGLKGMMMYASQANPRNRRAPTPRPDIVIVKGMRSHTILDAKYRDLWEASLPRDMLYQLTIYALSQGWNGMSAILYPTTTSSAVPQSIEVREPVSGHERAEVTLRPVHVGQLSEAIRMRGAGGQQRRFNLASELAFGN